MSAKTPTNAGREELCLPIVLLVARPGQAATELTRRMLEQGAEVRLQSPRARPEARRRVDPDLVVVMGQFSEGEPLLRRLLAHCGGAPVAVVAAGRHTRRALGALAPGDVLFTPAGDSLETTAARLVDLAAELRSKRQEVILNRSAPGEPPPSLPPPPPGSVLPSVPDRSSIRGW
ncbi:MAG: hypothetical protein JW940_25835 [Polyangiaceae bacterium]|nr:hypothetical protein [Polyangiaceae bacterium]